MIPIFVKASAALLVGFSSAFIYCDDSLINVRPASLALPPTCSHCVLEQQELTYRNAYRRREIFGALGGIPHALCPVETDVLQ